MTLEHFIYGAVGCALLLLVYIAFAVIRILRLVEDVRFISRINERNARKASAVSSADAVPEVIRAFGRTYRLSGNVSLADSVISTDSDRAARSTQGRSRPFSEGG